MTNSFANLNGSNSFDYPLELFDGGNIYIYIYSQETTIL